MRFRVEIGSGTGGGDSVKGIFALTRGASALAIGATLYFGSRNLGVERGEAFLDSLPFILAASGGSVLNDYFDRGRDAVDKPWRAIPSGLLREQTAVTIAVLLLGLSAVLSLVAGYDRSRFLLFLIAVASVSAYSLFVHHAASLKAPYVGLLCALPIISLLSRSSLPTWPVATAVAGFICGKELLMDVLDVKGDLQAGSRTAAIRLGLRRCAVLAFAMQLGSLILFAFALRDRLGSAGLLATACAAAWVFASAILWRPENPHRRRLLVHATWIPVGLTVTVLLAALTPG
jgi:geranylgeranylglycerol-phosphate geranylgeranyltransferase